MSEKEKYYQNIMVQIQEKTDLSSNDVETRVNKVMKLYEFDDKLTALFLVTEEIEKEKGVRIQLKKIGKEVKNMEKKEESFEVEKLEEDSPEPTYEITVPETQNSQQTRMISNTHQIERFPSEDEIRFLIERREFVKKNLLDKSDYYTSKQGNVAIRKSGYRKYINAFGISIELIERRVYEQFGEKHAEVRVRAITPYGQSVEGIGLKSWSQIFEKSLHVLMANAWTRAVNRAVSDLVGYGSISAEELIDNGK